MTITEQVEALADGFFRVYSGYTEYELKNDTIDAVVKLETKNRVYRIDLHGCIATNGGVSEIRAKVDSIGLTNYISLDFDTKYSDLLEAAYSFIKLIYRWRRPVV